MMDVSSRQRLFDISLSDERRLLKIATIFGDNRLLVQRVVVHEELSVPFTFTIDCFPQAHDLDLNQLLAQPATLSILQSDGTYRELHALVTDAARLIAAARESATTV